MSRSEITAWNTGGEVAFAEVDGAKPDELWAYLTGAARAHLGRGITGFLTLSRADLSTMLTDDARTAMLALPRDRWAYWVREGYDRTRAELGRPGRAG